MDGDLRRALGPTSRYGWRRMTPTNNGSLNWVDLVLERVAYVADAGTIVPALLALFRRRRH